MEAFRRLTLELRERLETIESEADAAHLLLSELEEAGGIVREDGSRDDEPPAAERFPGRRQRHDLAAPVHPGGVGKVRPHPVDDDE